MVSGGVSSEITCDDDTGGEDDDGDDDDDDDGMDNVIQVHLIESSDILQSSIRTIDSVRSDRRASTLTGETRAGVDTLDVGQTVGLNGAIMGNTFTDSVIVSDVSGCDVTKNVAVSDHRQFHVMNDVCQDDASSIDNDAGMPTSARNISASLQVILIVHTALFRCDVVSVICNLFL